MTGGWRTLGSRIAYENPWMRVREDQVRLPSGRIGVYGVVEKPPFVIVVPFDGRHLYLVRQYRHAIGGCTWELPQGSAETDDLAAAAARELREETGLRAERLTLLGQILLAPGFSAQTGSIFVAEGLRVGEQQLDESEEGLTVHAFAPAEVETMIRRGELLDGPSIAAYGRWRLLI